MAKIAMHGQGSMKETTSWFIEEMLDTGASVELLESSERTLGGVSLAVLVFEKYFMRASNRASLTVLFTSNGEDLFVDIIGAGGGQGVFFKLSWGSEEDFVYSARKVLEKRDFRELA